MRKFFALLLLLSAPSAFAETGALCTFSGSDVYVSVTPAPVTVTLSGASVPDESTGAVLAYLGPHALKVPDVRAAQDFFVYSVLLPLLSCLFFAYLLKVWVFDRNDFLKNSAS